MNNPIMLCLKNITHIYGTADQSVTVLKELNFQIERGKICAILGPSGSGKSTILQIAGLLDTPTSGTVTIDNEACHTLSDTQKSTIRGEKIGFIYQFHRLLPELTALENVMMPQLLIKKSRKDAMKRASELLQEVGLGHRLTHLPTELSGGEQQRVAIARALANKPKLILADEPTGNLDPVTSVHIFETMTKFVQNHGASALIATHNHQLAQKADFILDMQSLQAA